MVEVDVKAVLSRLNRSCTRALEGGAGLSVSRQHYEVTVEHVLHALIEDPYSDVQSILKHFGVDAGRVQKALAVTLDSMRSGNTGRPVFSPILIDWVKDAWMLGSLVHRDANALDGGQGCHLVCLFEVDADRLFDIDVHAVAQDPQAQLVVKLGTGRYGHDVRLGLGDHGVQVAVSRGHTQLVSEGVEQLRDQVAECHDVGAGVGVVGQGRRGAAVPAS